MKTFSVLILTILSALPSPARAQDDADDGINALVEVLGQVDDAAFHLDILKGINEALKGRRNVKMPASWTKVYPKLQKSTDVKVREAALNLALVFGDDSALKALKTTTLDAKASAAVRKAALQSLINAKAKQLAPMLHKLLSDRALRGDALRALAMYDHPKNGDIIITLYPSLSLEERRSALSTLASRTATGRQLITAIQNKTIARSDVPADTVRQLRLLKDKAIDAAIKETWGDVRDTPAAKKKQIDKLTKMLSAKSDYKPDRERGRALFAQTCQQCHTLFGVGGKVGPDITGSNRNNLDYVLQNVVDPNALVGKDYQATEVRTEDDQFVVGIIEREDAQTLTLKTAGGTVIIAKDEIETRKLSEKSMMPEALIDHLTDNQLRDFVAYLAGSTQVAMLATEANAWGLFNGLNLSNWQGDEKHWSVKDAVILGDASKATKPITLTSEYTATDFTLTFKYRGQGSSSMLVRATFDDRGVANGLILPLTLPREKHGKDDTWQTIAIHAAGDSFKISLNGERVGRVQKDDVSLRGVFVMQLAPGAMLQFKDIELKLSSLIESK